MFSNIKYDFKNKVVLVIGGSRGIGASLVKEFQRSNAKVFYCARNINKSLYKAKYIKCDLSYEDNVYDLFKEFSENQKLDILINTAAINFSREFNEIKYNEWKQVIDVNLNATFLVLQLASKIMIKNRSGKIVNISSIAGKSKSIASGAHYVSSKAGIIGLTRQLAYEVAKYNVNVNVLCPSQTMTDMLKQTMSEEEILELED